MQEMLSELATVEGLELLMWTLWEVVLVLWPFVVLVLGLFALKFLVGSWVSRVGELRRGQDALTTAEVQRALRGEAGVFERLCRVLFEANGYRVKQTGEAPEGGVDMAARGGGRKVVVHCRRPGSGPPGITAARELLGAVVAAGAHHGYLLTPGTVTAEARKMARGLPISLLGGAALAREARRALPDVVAPSGGSRAEPAAGRMPAPRAQAAEQKGPPEATLRRPPIRTEPLKAGYPIYCAQCGALDTVPFKPCQDQALLCWKCYKKRCSGS